MSVERPPGWLEAAGTCLDLSIPELALIDAQAQETAEAARRVTSENWVIAGRLGIIGIPASSDPVAFAEHAAPPDGDPTFLVVVVARETEPARIAWAVTKKPVTFELSDFERAVLNSGALIDQ
jgi:hypothetical protein